MAFQIIEKPFSRRPLEVDPITIDIIENALLNARREMDYVVFRSAMSTVIREQRDAYPLITDRDGRKVVGQFGSPIAGFTRGYHGTVEDGDVFLTSDPYECQGAISHCNDWLVVKPIYFEGHLVGWSGIFGHVMDIGGRVPGSVPINANQYYEEGIIIPPTKVYRRGELQTDIVNLIMHNSRASNSNRADLTALVAAAQLAARRVVEICERFGVETYVATCDLLLARNRNAISQLIDTSIPEGKTYYFEDYVCDDGCGMGPYKIACSMVKRGKKLYFDFDGTDPQSQGSINFIFNYEMFKMFVGAYLIKLYDPQIVFNAGYYDLIEVNIPPGCLLNPIKPAALSCRTGTLQRTFDVLIGLLGQCTPGLMTAAGYSQAPYLYYSGYDDNGEWFTLFYSGFGGVPGRPIGDGHDGYTLLPSFFNLPTEFAESYAPVRVEQYSIVPDSGGPGPASGRKRQPPGLLLRAAGHGVDPRQPLADPPVGGERRARGGAQPEVHGTRRRDSRTASRNEGHGSGQTRRPSALHYLGRRGLGRSPGARPHHRGPGSGPGPGDPRRRQAVRRRPGRGWRRGRRSHPGAPRNHAPRAERARALPLRRHDREHPCPLRVRDRPAAAEPARLRGPQAAGEESGDRGLNQDSSSRHWLVKRLYT